MEIGTLNEKPLHAALKAWYAQPGDRLEVKVDGYVIDILRGGLLVEVQTGNFAGIKRKVTKLAADHALRLVYPIAQEKWISKQLPGEATAAKRRKSPRHGSPAEVFRQLVSFPELICHSNFSLEVLMIQEEELRRFDGSRGWRRRGWVTVERRLLAVAESRLIETPADLWRLLPVSLPDAFTSAELAEEAGVSQRLAQQIAYCLRKMGELEQTGKRGRAYLYTRAAGAAGL
jgi:hypothetical protein